MTQNDTSMADTTKFVALIAQGASITDAIKVAKISRTKAHRLLENEQIKTEIRRFRAKTLTGAAGIFSKSLELAAKELLSLMQESENESIRLRAAGMIADKYLKITEREDVDERLSALEQRFEDG